MGSLSSSSTFSKIIKDRSLTKKFNAKSKLSRDSSSSPYTPSKNRYVFNNNNKFLKGHPGTEYGLIKRREYSKNLSVGVDAKLLVENPQSTSYRSFMKQNSRTNSLRGKLYGKRVCNTSGSKYRTGNPRLNSPNVPQQNPSQKVSSGFAKQNNKSYSSSKLLGSTLRSSRKLGEVAWPYNFSHKKPLKKDVLIKKRPKNGFCTDKNKNNLIKFNSKLKCCVKKSKKLKKKMDSVIQKIDYNFLENKQNDKRKKGRKGRSLGAANKLLKGLTQSSKQYVTSTQTVSINSKR